MTRRPTILDVAKAAGVSKSTVSLVLQGSDTVKDSTQQAVRQAMADLGYVYNRSAARLRSSSSGLIGLVINDIRNPFFTEFAASLQAVLTDHGYATVLVNTDEDPAQQSRMIGSLLEHGVSGLIISPAYGSEAEALAALTRSRKPVIQVFRRFGCASQMPFIAPDYQQGSSLATQHLIDQGCRRIAFLGGLDGRAITHERMEGYLGVLKAAGQDPTVLTGQATRGFGRDMAQVLRRDYPEIDGVLCFNDRVALGVLSDCAEHGPQIGRDLKVIGIDDIEECRDSFPALSSVSCNIPEIARLAAHGVLGWIKDGTPPQQITRCAVSLVKRASTEAG